MAVSQYFPGDRTAYMGLSTDTKPNAAVGSKFIETDTHDIYLMLNTGAWVQVGTLAPAATSMTVTVLI